MRKIWGGVLVLLGAFLILACGLVPARAYGMDGSRPSGSDYLTFAEEFRTTGAHRFYDQTEDMLRAGKFDRAFTRYLFLRANIRGQSLYAGLAADVDQRLKLLREQMHLGEEALQYEHKETYARRRRRVRPACPPAAKKTAKPKELSPEEKPPVMIIPAPSAEETAKHFPKEGAKTPGPEAKPSGEEAQKPGNGTQKSAPAPPLSFWEKFKRKLKFW